MTRVLGTFDWLLPRINKGVLALLLCTIVVAVVGYAFHPRVLMLLPLLLLLFVIGIAGPWLTVLGLRSELRFDKDRVHEQEEVGATLRYSQKLPLPPWGVIAEFGLGDPRWLPASLPYRTEELKLSLVPPHRGAYPLAVPRFRSGFPFGLCYARRSISVDQKLIVWPRTFPVAAPPDWLSTDAATGHIETRRAGTDGETCGVRAYRRGDPMRWIHWTQTARHGRMMVREFQATGTPKTLIVLDCDPQNHVGEGTDSSFEWSIRIVASLASGWLAAGAEVELRAGALHMPATGGQRQSHAILDGLATVALSHDSSHRVVIGHDIPVVFISTDIGWATLDRQQARAWRGFALVNTAFGGDRTVATAALDHVVSLHGPASVPANLLGQGRGLADVA